MTDAAAAYELGADEFLARRDRSPIGARVVAGWARSLPAGAAVLELACGGGLPVSRALVDAGVELRAIDASPRLAETFRRRFPNVPVRCERVQRSDFFDRRHDAIIAVGLLFLLPEPEQEALLGQIADRLEPGGRFFFTAPLEIGRWNDLNTGLACHSLGRVRYERVLGDVGLPVTGTHVDRGGNHYYDTTRCAVPEAGSARCR